MPDERGMHQVTIRFEPELYEALRRLAFEERTAMSALVKEWAAEKLGVPWPIKDES